MSGMNTDKITLGIVWYIVFIISLSFHEAAHAFAAMKLGDKTAFHKGLVSIHPLVHMARQPFGMILLPIISYFYNGWMIGWASTPFDPAWAQSHPKREMLMAMAGPLANLVLFLAAAVTIRVGFETGHFYPPESITFSKVTAAGHTGLASSIALVMSIFFTLNLILFIFNLLPIPPLDGSNLVPLILRGESSYKYKALIRQPAFAIIGLLIAWQLFGFLFGPIHLFAINHLYPGVTYGH